VHRGKGGGADTPAPPGRERERERTGATDADRWDPPVKRSGRMSGRLVELGLTGQKQFSLFMEFLNAFLFYFLYGIQTKFKFK
jgi:hypothetical protein